MVSLTKEILLQGNVREGGGRLRIQIQYQHPRHRLLHIKLMMTNKLNPLTAAVGVLDRDQEKVRLEEQPNKA